MCRKKGRLPFSVGKPMSSNRHAIPNIRYRPDTLWQYFLILHPMQNLANYNEGRQG
jgi:hypothetical protein